MEIGVKRVLETVTGSCYLRKKSFAFPMSRWFACFLISRTSRYFEAVALLMPSSFDTSSIVIDCLFRHFLIFSSNMLNPCYV